MAPHVGRFHLVANGARHDHVRALAESTSNVVIEDRHPRTRLGLRRPLRRSVWQR